MLSKINSKNVTKNLLKFLKIKDLLNIFKYSKQYLSLFNLTKKSTKYYNIAKLMFKTNPLELLDNKYIFYCLIRENNNGEFPDEDQICFKVIRDKMFFEALKKRVTLKLDDNIENLDEDDGEDLLMNFRYYKYIKPKNFDLTIDSNLTLSDEAEKFFYEKIKPECTNLYLKIDDENKFIERLIDNWKGNVYSLTFLSSIEYNSEIFKRILLNQYMNCIYELNINYDLKDKKEDKDLLYKQFLPKCTNLKNLILNYLPKGSEGYGNFLINCNNLKELIIEEGCAYNSIETFKDIILDGNKIDTFVIGCDLNTDQKNNNLKEFIIDFSFVEKLKNLNLFQLTFNYNGKVIPKNLFNSLNNLPKLKTVLLLIKDKCYIEGINNINIINLKNFALESDEIEDDFDYERFINNHQNLSYFKINTRKETKYKNISYPSKLEKFEVVLANDNMLIPLLKQIQIKSIPLIELHFKIKPLLGQITNDCFHELANSFKYLPNLKSLVINGIQELREDKIKNIEWIENLKYLKNLNYFELAYYEFNYQELKLFVKSVRNLEFLEEIKFYDGKFNQKKVLQLFMYYKLPPILKKFNIISLCDEFIDSDDDNDNETYSDSDFGQERPVWEFPSLIESFGYPNLEG